MTTAVAFFKIRPGTRWIEFPDRRVDWSKTDDRKWEAVGSRLLMYVKKGGRPAIVGRQMQDGDMVLINQQVRDDIMTIHVLDTNPRKKHMSCTTLKQYLLDYDHYHRWKCSRNVALTAVLEDWNCIWFFYRCVFFFSFLTHVLFFSPLCINQVSWHTK
jgi:hypothetical protein